MISPARQQLVVGALMVMTAFAAYGLTPRDKLADQGEPVDLEAMIPDTFGDWRKNNRFLPVAALTGDQEDTAAAIYDQVLMRTYENSRGEQVMLSIAYGSDQSDRMRVHKPEVCYSAQGFSVGKRSKGVLSLPGVVVPVTRLVAVQEFRYEPITYWIMVGDKAVSGKLDQKLEQLRYGLTGTVPDGMLVRASSISRDADAGYKLQERFFNDLVSALEGEAKKRLVGRVQTTSAAHG